MPNVPDNAKKPTDHKDKSSEAPERFSFEHNGETYTLKPTYDVLTPGFLRKNRRRDDMDQFFTMLEGLVDDTDSLGESVTLNVVDNMSQREFRELVKEFFDYLEVAGSGE